MRHRRRLLRGDLVRVRVRVRVRVMVRVMVRVRVRVRVRVDLHLRQVDPTDARVVCLPVCLPYQ